ncbi:MAG TPA: amino acid adenylation domain-containing protein, partial [Candidatus Eisenbacteria bacterium]|nr:amino acid adenylation domain-containing protein [Candidatus Eisenbacteria bacterium]
MSDFAAPPTVPELFAAQARRTPDAPALGFDGGEMAYGELARKVERVAAGLRARGVGPETVVACALGRRPELVVALLAVLRAGGVHLPVDPDWPPERRAAVLADASPRLVISSDRDLPDADPAPAPWPHPDSLAYVIYTSGSTGAPKGVMVAHRSLSNLVRAQAAAYRSGPGTRILQFAAAVFDGSISETLRALVSGAALVIARQADLMPGPALLACLRDRAITMATIPPTALAAMDREPLPRLETLITAAEACPREVAERWSPGRRFLNAYGPTEATVCASFGEYRGEDRPPIGRPLAGVTLHVVDEHLRPAPGGRGELCVGGAGVARGYLGRPAPTAAAFLPDPFGPPGARMYRTGDLVRRLADGSHEFLGRGDRQVKVRGHRIEPGEVEAALTAHPAVRQAVCTAWTGADGALRLAAYVVAGDPAPTARELRGFLRGRLPAY